MAHQALNTSRSLAGRWHLIAADWPGDDPPAHRVDLVFHEGPVGLRGAVLSRQDGQEIALEALAFDGTNLRLKMGRPSGQLGVDTPFLVMKSAGEHFEGGWDQVGVEQVRLKLVRAGAEAAVSHGA